MRHHGLLKPRRWGRKASGPWTFQWSRSINAFGQCIPSDRRIRLSRVLVERNPPWEVLDCILHEIAHALTPGASHGPVWRAVAQRLGCDAGRCYASDQVVGVRRRYVYSCACGRIWPRHRRTLERHRCTRCRGRLICTDVGAEHALGVTTAPMTGAAGTRRQSSP